jgi:hypothetical protein
VPRVLLENPRWGLTSDPPESGRGTIAEPLFRPPPTHCHLSHAQSGLLPPPRISTRRSGSAACHHQMISPKQLSIRVAATRMARRPGDVKAPTRQDAKSRPWRLHRPGCSNGIQCGLEQTYAAEKPFYTWVNPQMNEDVL